jgi:cytidine deaminase
MLTNEQRQTLIQSALQARQRAYAPYSHYLVGAALLTVTGQLYQGCNVENAAYPTSMCAERVAIYKAVSEGAMQFTAIAVATVNGGTPCGSCRQVLAEFGLDMIVLVVDGDGRLCQETSARALLPGAFGPQDLNNKG